MTENQKPQLKQLKRKELEKLLAGDIVYMKDGSPAKFFKYSERTYSWGVVDKDDEVKYVYALYKKIE